MRVDALFLLYLIMALCFAKYFLSTRYRLWGFPGGSAVKNLPAVQKMQKTQFRSLGKEDALEEGMAAHSSILAWRIPWTEEPSGLQSMGPKRVGYD